MRRTKKERPYPDKTIIKGALRRVMARSPVIKYVMDLAVHPTKKGVRGGKQFTCAICNNAYPANQVAVDHIEPVVPTHRTLEDMDYNEMVERIFCAEHKLQVLCDSCHKAKTKYERTERKNAQMTKKEAQKELAQSLEPIVRW